MPDMINLIIQIIAGFAGGNAAGELLKDYDLGLGNMITGTIAASSVDRSSST